MKIKGSAPLVKYGLSIAITLLMAYLYLVQRVDLSIPSTTAKLDLYKALCDAFTIPGFLFILMGALMSLSCQGALDGISFVMMYAFKMLIPGKGHERPRYWDFVEEKNAKRPKGFGFLYVVGGITVAISLVFYGLYYSVYS